MNLNGKVFTSKSVGTGPSSYEKRIYRAAVSQRLRNTELDDDDDDDDDDVDDDDDDDDMLMKTVKMSRFSEKKILIF